MNRTSTTTAVVSFLCGVATTCTVVMVCHVAAARARRKRFPENVGWTFSAGWRKTDGGNGATSLAVTEKEPPPPPLLWDHPDLDLRLIRKAEAVIQGRTDAIIIVVERCTNDHNYSAILRTAEALGIQTVYIIDPPAPTVVGQDGTVQFLSTAATVANETDETNTNDNNQGGNESYVNDRSTMPVIRLTSESEKKAFADHRKFAQNATEWLTIHEFGTTTECLQRLKADGYQVWVTDLSQEAVPLTVNGLQQRSSASSSPLPCWPMPPKIALVMGTEAVGCSQEMLVGGDLRVYLPLVGFADSLNLSVATALVIQQVLHLNPSYAGAMSEENRRALRQAWFPKLAQQRLLSSRGKKQRKSLLKQIQICERLQAKQDSAMTSSATNGDEPMADVLTVEQRSKLAKLPQYQQELHQLEHGSHFDLAEQTVSDLIAHPPQPLSDVRRADPHRVTFVGKKTKKLHSDHWKDLVATTNTTTTLNATASFFRQRIRPTHTNGT
jgi:tRNA G18 (ribose-2'-O)-methylase SpoU